MLRADPEPLLAARHTFTMRPMPLQTPALVAIVDTNVLMRTACSAVRSGRNHDNLFAGLAVTGRSNVFVGAHVPGELAKHLEDVAASVGVSTSDAERVLREALLPHVRVVDVAVGDCLSPRALSLLRRDPPLRGDPDDIETVAVAELLAPAVILSADSVFSRLGMASTAVSWIETARNLLRSAGFEASYAETAQLVEFVGRLFFAGVEGVVRLASRYPLPVLVVLAVGLVAARLGYVDMSRLWAGVRRLGVLAQPMLEAIGRTVEGWEQARGPLFVVEPDGTPSLEQLAARHLARRSRALTPVSYGTNCGT